MFRQVKSADYGSPPAKPSHNTANESMRPVTTTQNVLATEPLAVSQLAPKPSVLGDSQAGAFALALRTGWAMLSAPGGTRLWPLRGAGVDVSPLLFKSDEPQLPVFLEVKSRNQPEAVLCGMHSGLVSHIRRISVQADPTTVKIPLSGDTLQKAVAVGYNVVVATSTGNLWLVQFADGFGGVSAPKVSKMSRNWFQLASPIQDIRAKGDQVAVLRVNGMLSLYKVGATVEHVQDVDLSQLGGFLVSVDFSGSFIFALTRGDTFVLSRLRDGLLEQQRILRDVDTQEPGAFVEVQNTTVYILFSSQLLVLNYGMGERRDEVLHPVQGKLWLRASPIGLASLDDGCVVLTQQGVLEVSGTIKRASLDSLLQQAVFYWSEDSPLTFVPAILELKDQDSSLEDAAIKLAHKIATSRVVPALPNIFSHLAMRCKYLRTLSEFLSANFGLFLVEIQNTWEQLETVKAVVANVARLDIDHDWLLYKAQNALELVPRVGAATFVEALSRALDECATGSSRSRPLTSSYWLASPELVAQLRNTAPKVATVRIMCTALSCLGDSTDEQNKLLKRLALDGSPKEASQIAQSLCLWAPLAGLLVDEWLASDDFTLVCDPIERYGYDFASLVFDYILFIELPRLISLFPFKDFVYRYVDHDPAVQWAFDRENGNSDATRKLELAARSEQDLDQRLLLTGLLQFQATTANAPRLAASSSHEIARLVAKTQVRDATTKENLEFLPKVVVELVKYADDDIVKLALLEPEPANLAAAANLLHEATPAHAKLLALCIIGNTKFEAGERSGLMWDVLRSGYLESRAATLLCENFEAATKLDRAEVASLVPAQFVEVVWAFVQEWKARALAHTEQPWVGIVL